MKKIVIFMLFGLIAFCSCTKNNVVETPSENINELDALKLELLELNSTLPPSKDVITKAPWWKYLLVGVADAVGGFIPGGSVSTAISASSLAWTILKEEKKSSESSTGSSTSTPAGNPSLNPIESALVNVGGDGEVHNKVIVNIFEKYGEEMFSLPENELNNEISKEVSLQTGEPLEVVKITPQQSVTIHNVVDAYVTSATVDEFMCKVSPTLANPELSEVVEVILSGYERVDISTDNGTYEAAVNKTIEKSKISTTSKDCLKSVSSVANASTRLWNVNSLE